MSQACRHAPEGFCDAQGASCAWQELHLSSGTKGGDPAPPLASLNKLSLSTRGCARQAADLWAALPAQSAPDGACQAPPSSPRAPVRPAPVRVGRHSDTVAWIDAIGARTAQSAALSTSSTPCNTQQALQQLGERALARASRILRAAQASSEPGGRCGVFQARKHAPEGSCNAQGASCAWQELHLSSGTKGGDPVPPLASLYKLSLSTRGCARQAADLWAALPAQSAPDSACQAPPSSPRAPVRPAPVRVGSHSDTVARIDASGARTAQSAPLSTSSTPCNTQQALQQLGERALARASRSMRPAVSLAGAAVCPRPAGTPLKAPATLRGPAVPGRNFIYRLAPKAGTRLPRWRA